jgi:Kdo2-lipid IVA lauroyltransferase/acyltransferase
VISKTTSRRLEAAAARALWALLEWLPLDAASGFAGGLARTVGPRLGVSRVARRNLKRAFPDWDDARVEATVREVWDTLGRVVGEFPHIAEIARDRVEVVGTEIVHRLRDDGKPGIFVSAHLGNWELAGATVCREGIPVTLVYRAANNHAINALFAKGRAPAALGGQIAKGPEGARELLAVLKKGGHLGMLIDQKMNDGIKVPFFGRDAMTAPAVARFAVKFGCPVVPVRVERLKGARFRITFHEPVAMPASGDAHADTLALMTTLNAVIESWVRARPGQWFWLHKRWPE